MVKHNNVIPNGHFKKHWQNYVKTWFNQPARKTRRRVGKLFICSYFFLSFFLFSFLFFFLLIACSLCWAFSNISFSFQLGFLLFFNMPICPHLLYVAFKWISSRAFPFKCNASFGCWHYLLINHMQQGKRRLWKFSPGQLQDLFVL